MTTTLFALDIGTRSVVGIILKAEGETYHVADLMAIEHQERSMIDGQIHNILSVASVIKEIKETLEKKHGPLKKVSVAAAGRALKTVEGTMQVDILERPLTSVEDVNRLELSAVQRAQHDLIKLNDGAKNDNYYCVGYSVLHYKLDDEPIGNLIDQTGHRASVDVIATFLPRVVVESLMSALKRSELEMEALTLEPIAAIQVLIPPSMRRLNVALVDIGAGTSDIAITDNNTIISYGMVPIAGDEITEALSSEYLLDFPLAENVKRMLTTNDEVVITDILGFETTLPSEEVKTVIKPTAKKLAQAIAAEIQKLNNGVSPKAVILVGGGSLTSDLPRELSTYLELPENRVGIRGLEALSAITTAPHIVSSPDLITPIGIAIAGRRAPIHYMSVTVDKKTIRLFELKEMTVGDALLAGNISARQLYGKPGHGMTITVNDKDVIIPGGHGTPSTILLNGKDASTKDLLTNGDDIEIIYGKDGQDATATGRDLFEDAREIQVAVNEEKITLAPTITINENEQQLDTSIQDRDKIIFSQQFTVADALKKVDKLNDYTDRIFTLYVDQNPIAIHNKSVLIYLNEKSVNSSQLIHDGDKITVRKPPQPTAADIAFEAGHKAIDQITITFNGKETDIEKVRFTFKLNGQQIDGATLVKPSDKLELITVNNKPIVFSDIFAFTNYSLPSNTTGAYKLLRNGKSIGFNDPIFGGDRLEIAFLS